MLKYRLPKEGDQGEEHSRFWFFVKLKRGWLRNTKYHGLSIDT